MSSANSRSRRRAAGPLLAGLVVVLVIFAGWRLLRPSSAHLPGSNILLITIDTLRADAVGAYGRAGGPTPLIDRLAAAGVRFTDAHAHNVVTLPSHANILSGRLPFDHGVRDNGGFRLSSEAETLATLLRRQGYRTGAFVSAFPLDSRFGLASGFEVYDDRFVDAGPRPAFLMQERSAQQTVQRAVDWIAAAGDGPWFSWVHLFEPHFPYDPPEPYASRWRSDPYLGEVATADAALAPLLDPILAAGRDGRTLVVITSDHGEALGEHGEASHGIFAYESVLRVPLVLYQPQIFRSQVIDAPAQHVDLLPTLLDAVALPLPPGLAGRSLLPAITRQEPGTGATVYFEALSASFNRGWAPLRGHIHDGFKYVDLPIPELYDLRSDPRELHNLAAVEPARVSEARARLQAFDAGQRPGRPSPESSEVRERLRSLGYAAASPRAPRDQYTEDDDPKRLIALDGVLRDILARYLAGDLPGARTEARQLAERRPTMAATWMQLAHLERESGDLGAAVAAMRRAAELRPGDTETLGLLGGYLTEAGRPQEAADLLAPYAEDDRSDPDLLSAFALALARLGQTDAALAALSRARAQDPSNAMVLVHVGTVQLTGGRRDAAREAFAEAVRINPDAARAHSSLGAIALEEGRVERAWEHWRRATALDAGEHEKILSLGLALMRAGRTAEARACVQFFAAHAPPARYAPQIERARLWLNGVR